MTTITGTFDTRSEAESAINALEARGISPSEISLIVSDESKRKMFNDNVSNDERARESASGAGKGAVIGGSLTAIVAGLTAVGVMTIPGVGLLASGPVVAFLAGGGAGAAVGGLAGALIGAGIPDAEANEYENAVKSGKALVTVHTDNNSKALAAREILRPYNSFYQAA